jgi:hypothetical protein
MTVFGARERRLWAPRWNSDQEVCKSYIVITSVALGSIWMFRCRSFRKLSLYGRAHKHPI